MKTTHTPGPWELDKYGEIETPNGILVVAGVVTPTAVHPLAEEAEANARLIAAAPELLEAPIVAHECGRPSKVTLYDEEGIEGWRWTHPDGREWELAGSWDETEPMHPVVAAAIAKATGDQS